jgi:hypothetical protein
MNKFNPSVFLAFGALTLFASSQTRADEMASIDIVPATGRVTLSPRWSVGANLSGFHVMAQDLHIGGEANDFYSIKGTAIPSGGDITAFTHYVAASGFGTNHTDIGSKLTPTSYSALTSADPDIGYGSVNLYFIHHKSTGDYFTVIVPGSGTSSAVTDLKPMSGPGGPATLGGSGYFGLTFAASNLGYGLNLFYYLRTDPATALTKFGILDPALLGTSTDEFDLGLGGHKALVFTGTDVGFGTNKMYYLRLDPVTGFTIFGTLHPQTGKASDIANLGSVYSTLTFDPDDIGFGVGQFYTTGTAKPTRQSVSFAAIAGRGITAGPFTVNPSASSGLPITLTVVTGSATISAPTGGVFTVTPKAPGLITLQASQAGQSGPTAYEFNMLRQSFVATEDFNSDGMTDILWQNSSTGERYLWLMDGTMFSSGVSLGFFTTDWQMVAAADFNGDGLLDILWQNTSTGERSITLMDGTLFNGGPSLGIVSNNWQMVAAADFNGDGKADILWQNTVTGERYIWLMNGTAYGSGVSLGIVPTAWRIAAVADFNSDGKPDILWQNTSTGERFIWLMNGTAQASGVSLGTVSTAWQIAAAGDYNGDGKPDILWQNTTTGERYIWLMNGITFSSSVPLGTISTQWQIVR